MISIKNIQIEILMAIIEEKNTKELTFEINKSEATINRAFKSALLKVKDAYDKNLIKF